MIRLARSWRIVLLTAAATGVALATSVAWVVPLSSDAARQRLVAVLASRLDGEVDIRTLRWRAFPFPFAEGEGVTVRHRGRRDVAPLISIRHFSATGSVLGLLRRHISRVTITGLDIEIPPDRNRDKKSSAPGEESSDRESARGEKRGGENVDVARTLVIDDLVSSDARLVIIPSEPARDPRVWHIHDLHMTSVGFDRAMPFEATLTNALPPGAIASRGTFGPWRSEEPGRTPVDGSFSFQHANLAVFKGVAGILSSSGT